MTQSEMIRALAEVMFDWATKSNRDIPKLERVLAACGKESERDLEWGGDPVIEKAE